MTVYGDGRLASDSVSLAYGKCAISRCPVGVKLVLMSNVANLSGLPSNCVYGDCVR